MIPAMIVPVLIRHDLLDRMIKSINYPVRDLVIINNNPTIEYEPTWNPWVHKIHQIKMPSNLGVASSWNLGIMSLPYADYWLVSNFDVEWAGESLQQFHEQSSVDKLVLSGGAPSWCAFSIGWKVLDKVGLFSQDLHPAYFEDNDYERRCEYHGVEVVKSFIPLAHDNSSTIKNGYDHLNNRTFTDNLQYFQDKVARNDFSEGYWSIRRRRRNGWD